MQARNWLQLGKVSDPHRLKYTLGAAFFGRAKAAAAATFHCRQQAVHIFHMMCMWMMMMMVHVHVDHICAACCLQSMYSGGCGCFCPFKKCCTKRFLILLVAGC